MRKQMIVLGMLLHFAAPAPAQVSFGFGFQTDNISISLSNYPNLVRVPGYPVYYASELNSNYFFYDGLYWVFEADRWYSSSWYNGPWMMVDPEFIPLYLLRVPVRYYRRPPAFFVGWQANSPPRWGDHWGNEWSQNRSGWDRRNRQSMPPPAPLPTYQRKYAGERYPSADRQQSLQSQNYRHEARDPLVRQQSNASPAPRTRAEPDWRDRTPSPPTRTIEPSTPSQRPAASTRQDAPAPPQQQPQRVRERQEQERPAQAAPRMEAPPAPRSTPQYQRETNMRPQAEANPQHAQPANEGRSNARQGEQGQRPGQQRDRDNADERGQGQGQGQGRGR